jgi:hypothetical protein
MQQPDEDGVFVATLSGSAWMRLPGRTRVEATANMMPMLLILAQNRAG